MLATRFEKLYCDECWCAHWVEVTESRKEICHGKDYLPKESATHYTRWKAGGIELVQKSPRQNIKALDWQMAKVAFEDHEGNEYYKEIFNIEQVDREACITVDIKKGE